MLHIILVVIRWFFCTGPVFFWFSTLAFSHLISIKKPSFHSESRFFYVHLNLTHVRGLSHLIHFGQFPLLLLLLLSCSTARELTVRKSFLILSGWSIPIFLRQQILLDMNPLIPSLTIRSFSKSLAPPFPFPPPQIYEKKDYCLHLKPQFPPNTIFQHNRFLG